MEKALRNRLTFGSLMLGGLFGILWFDSYAQSLTRKWRLEASGGLNGDGVQGLGLLILLMLASPLAVEELAVLFTAERVRPYRIVAGVGSAALVLHAFLTQFEWFKPVAASTLAFIVVFVMLLAALRRAWAKQTQDAIVRMAGTVLATLYLGGLSWFLMAIRVKHSLKHGDPHAERFVGSTMLILMILVVVKATDIGAYFGGRKLGKHKLIPWLSPGKTWEGLACGVVFSGIVGAIFAPFLHHMPTPWWKGFIISMVLGAIGQAGDLLESMMKRDAEVKDSGRLVPGFGGILDIIDSPLLAAPFAYLLFSFFMHSQL
ncbi:MAG TPA: phosphatidate cytidylyltransferase [Tepidisphaeraceae bacterium]|jgi:phosphatidate cytidylyltransferase|nr:phosphatidate cytidylyltransferase [Tepidisphaeraceae bacterium]